ncbi:MAG: AraC family transcriptional regulator [Lentisphaeria bacterium]|nr:AraC family transcriptional regulator [Lentisphaeria bacterium]
MPPIARKANFPHTYYMCRLFRERFGLTPLQYRKCHRG